MIKKLLLVSMVLIFGGCTQKEFNKGANDIGNDISRLFEVRE